MNEQLSRLLAGELDPAAEAALRARIAADPSLAAAWERMCALPELLGALPLEAPPPALMAKLYAMTPAALFDDTPADLLVPDAAEAALDAALAELAARPAAAAALSFDPAPFAPDPREDTIDPEPPRAGAPRRLSAVATDAGRSDTRRADTRRADARSSRAVTRSAAERAPATVRPWLAAGVAAAALALGVGLGLTVDPTPDAPAALTLAAGESVVEGDVRVRAGGLDLHVDGRARISVTPGETAAAGTGPAYADAADLVVVGARDAAPAAHRAQTQREARAIAAREARASAEREAAEADATPRGYAVAGTVSRAVEPLSGIVTIEVERGAAVVTAAGRDVRVAAGQTRSFDPAGAPATLPVHDGPGKATVDGARPEAPHVRVDPSVAHRDLPIGGLAALPRVLAALDTTATTTEWPADLDTMFLPDGVEARMLDVESLVADAELVDVDCDEYPCLAVWVSTAADPAWIDDVRATLRAHYPARAAVLDVVESLDGLALAVSVAPIDAPAARLRVDRRLDDAVRDVRREYGTP